MAYPLSNGAVGKWNNKPAVPGCEDGTLENCDTKEEVEEAYATVLTCGSVAVHCLVVRL